MKKSAQTALSAKDQALLEEISEYLQTHNPNPAMQKRLLAIQMSLMKTPTATIVSQLDIPRTTFYTWLRKAREKGVKGLERKAGSGRHPTLTEQEKKQIKEALLKDPQTYGFKSWDGKSLSEYIEREFGKKFGVRAAQRLFHDLGFLYLNPVRPRGSKESRT